MVKKATSSKKVEEQKNVKTKKVKKVSKNENTEVIKKSNKTKASTSNKKNKKQKKQGILKRLVRFFVDVKKELLKVRWPDKKSMIKYSIATLVFVVVFSLFFYLIDVIFAFIKSLV